MRGRCGRRLETENSVTFGLIFSLNALLELDLSSLQLSNYKEIVSSHRGSVDSHQVDFTEGRYLLAGAADATVAVYDIQQAKDYDVDGLIAKHKFIFFINKQHENGHNYAVSSAIWYPIDTGLFVTGSYDHKINVWDTNTTQASQFLLHGSLDDFSCSYHIRILNYFLMRVVMDFSMPGKIYKTAMSSIARPHMLIAAGTEDVQVRLCDIFWCIHSYVIWSP